MERLRRRARRELKRKEATATGRWKVQPENRLKISSTDKPIGEIRTEVKNVINFYYFLRSYFTKVFLDI